MGDPWTQVELFFRTARRSRIIETNNLKNCLTWCASDGQSKGAAPLGCGLIRPYCATTLAFGDKRGLHDAIPTQRLIPCRSIYPLLR